MYGLTNAQVQPFVVRKVIETFKSEANRLDVLATALLVQSENPDRPPARVFVLSVKRWFRLQRASLGLTETQGAHFSRRHATKWAGTNDLRLFSPVDHASSLDTVCAAVYDPSCERIEQDRLVELIVVLLGQLGVALQEGQTMEQAARTCGMSLRTAYRKVDSVREVLSAA